MMMMKLIKCWPGFLIQTRLIQIDIRAGQSESSAFDISVLFTDYDIRSLYTLFFVDRLNQTREIYL